MSTARALRLLGLAVLVGLFGLVIFAGLWHLQGGQIERVETPSMGTRAPVGSLLWVKPVPVDQLRPGDFITFHPPHQPHTTYSHLVRAVHSDGSISTGGVVSGNDPWRLHDDDIVGEVTMTWPIVGRVIDVSPILIIGALLIALVIAWLPRYWRIPVALVGASVVLAVVIVVHRPLVNAEQVAFEPVDHGAQATYVGTGLLPVRLAAQPHGNQVVLDNGEVGSVHVEDTAQHNRYVVRLSPAVPFLFWLGLVVLCFLPALAGTATRLARRPG